MRRVGGALDDYMKARMPYSTEGMANNRESLILLDNVDGTNTNRFKFVSFSAFKAAWNLPTCPTRETVRKRSLSNFTTSPLKFAYISITPFSTIRTPLPFAKKLKTKTIKAYFKAIDEFAARPSGRRIYRKLFRRALVRGKTEAPNDLKTGQIRYRF